MEWGVQFSSVQLLSCVQLSATPWPAVCQASLSITNSWSLLKLTSIELVMPPNHLILCHPLLLLTSISPSIRVFSNKSALCIRWPRYWSFSISPSSEYSGLTSFRIDWFDLLGVQGTLKSLLQHHSLKASILCQRTLAASSRTPSDSRALQATQVPHQTLMSMPSFPHCRAPSSALSSCA